MLRYAALDIHPFMLSKWRKGVRDDFTIERARLDAPADVAFAHLLETARSHASARVS